MKFLRTAIDGALIVETESHVDERGVFARTFCAEEFRKHGLEFSVCQCSVSFNPTRGTLRGLHSQASPHEEVKLVRCSSGAIHDVIVDLRGRSATFMKHFAVRLSSENRQSLYIPKGVFHGFLTLDNDTEVYYQMSAPYVAGAGLGYRWNDPAFRIQWPLEVSVISPRDASYPDFQP